MTTLHERRRSRLLIQKQMHVIPRVVEQSRILQSYRLYILYIILLDYRLFIGAYLFVTFMLQQVELI